MINKYDYLNANDLIALSMTCKGWYKDIIKNPHPQIAKIITEYEVNIASTIASNKATSVFKKINENWQYVSNSTAISSKLPESWKAQKVNTGKDVISALIWRNDKQLNLVSAIHEIINYKMECECANAARIARLAIICSVLGKEGTNRWLLKNINSTLDFNLFQNLSWAFAEKTDNFEQTGIYLVPFVNIKEYKVYKPDGSDACFNLIRLNNGKFIGFASIFRKGEKSFDEVEKFTYECFISSMDVESSLIEKHKQYVKKLTFEEYKNKRRSYQNEIGYYKLNLVPMIKLAKGR